MKYPIPYILYYIKNIFILYAQSGNASKSTKLAFTKRNVHKMRVDLHKQEEQQEEEDEESQKVVSRAPCW